MTTAPAVFEVPRLLDGVRIDRVVSMLTGVSRAAAAEMVAGGHVVVDGQPVTTRSTVVAAGSTVTVSVAEEQAGPAAEPEIVLDVVHEDGDVVVVDKPAGMVVHPGAGNTHGTMVGGLLARYPDLSRLVDDGVCDPRRPGIVQRLDKGTSGLLVVARNADAYHSLVDQLTQRAVDRRYHALVVGRVAEDRGVVDAPIGRSARTPTRMAVSANGREARTGYEVIERLDEPHSVTLLSLALETGRTHQIRVHLAAIGHPVVGDDRYGRGAGISPRLIPAGRLFLHAARLGFVHPGTGEHVQWESPLPDDLASALEGLRQPGGRR
jgi:23S rRNA pseudouridine1911/1915/1917 synthase